ncbi:MAG: glycosyltransferase family 4 protein [Eubacteriales bacterium]|nr:glycosyltransferase family 4 protein [Eubacteriales bacterium]
MSDKRIKVLFFHHGGNQGGAPRSLAFLIDHMDKMKYDPYVLCCLDFEDNKKLFESVAAKILYAPKMGAWHGSTVSGMSPGMLYFNMRHVIPTYFGIAKIMREVNPDIVHLNSTCLAFAAKAIRKHYSEIPIVCHVREPLLDGIWGDILRKLNDSSVDHYIAIEKYDADSLHTQLPVDIIYNFVDFKIYNTDVKSECLRNELGISKKDFLMLYLARISPENGALEMLKSILPLLKRRKDIHLCLVGATPDNRTQYLIDVEELCVGMENIHILPFRKDVPQVIASSDIMLVPFQQPHFARSVIEASAMGVPSVASNIGGITELVLDQKTGLLFDYHSFAGLIEQCELLADNVEYRNELGRNAVEFAHEYFDAVKNTIRTCEVYDRVLAMKRGNTYAKKSKK